MSLLMQNHSIIGAMGNGGGGNVVRIGGRNYPIVQIGNLYWMAKNLDYKWDGLIISADEIGNNNIAAQYRNADERTYGYDGTYKIGLYYSWKAAKHLNDNRSLLPEGWRVPSKSDFEALINDIGGSQNYKKLAAVENSVTQGFPNYNFGGTDDFGFKGVPSGYWSYGYMNFNSSMDLWSTTTNNQSSYYLNLAVNVVQVPSLWQNSGLCIRLCKYANSVHIGDNDYPIVKIGNLWWMAENLKEVTPNSVASSYRSYKGSDVQSIKAMAPDGWRLPTKDDYLNLFNFYGTEAYRNTFVEKSFLKKYETSITRKQCTNENGLSFVAEIGDCNNSVGNIFYGSENGNAAYFKIESTGVVGFVTGNLLDLYWGDNDYAYIRFVKDA